MQRAVIGDWKGSDYDIGGLRTDFHLFLDHNHRYERITQTEGKEKRRDTGTWQVSEPDGTLRLTADNDEKSHEWWLLSVTTCERSNVLLVLRSAILAPRNLPVLFYRVHGDGRGYGTDWERRLADRSATDASTDQEISGLD